MKSSLIFFLVFLLSVLLFGATDSFGVATQKKAMGDESEVREVTEQFLAAFANLDWDRFDSFFAKEATAFFPPSAKVPMRADGKENIENVFKTAFENARKQKSAPPYVKIEPKEMKIQMLENVGIVTFHLEDPGVFGRRTIIFHKSNGKWLIEHLHASGIMRPK